MGLSHSQVVPPGLSACEHGVACPPAAALLRVLSIRLPVYAPPTGLGECFFFKWLSDFHTVRFSGSSGWFLFLNLLLSFFWLCEEAQCVYLHLQLGQKSEILQYLHDYFITICRGKDLAGSRVSSEGCLL